MVSMASSGARRRREGAPSSNRGQPAFDSWPSVFRRLRDVDSSGSSISDANLSQVQIRDSNLEGMSIDGIPVHDLLAAYHGSVS
jgi:hypothetical protein